MKYINTSKIRLRSTTTGNVRNVEVTFSIIKRIETDTKKLGVLSVNVALIGIVSSLFAHRKDDFFSFPLSYLRGKLKTYRLSLFLNIKKY